MVRLLAVLVGVANCDGSDECSGEDSSTVVIFSVRTLRRDGDGEGVRDV